MIQGTEDKKQLVYIHREKKKKEKQNKTTIRSCQEWTDLIAPFASRLDRKPGRFFCCDFL